MTNVAFVYQPHFMSRSFRANLENQQGTKNNYIVVTCAPAFNGLYKYPAGETKSYRLWQNKSVTCVCVPISACEKIKDLDEITEPELIEGIKRQQEKWYKNEVDDNKHKYTSKPDWML